MQAEPQAEQAEPQAEPAEQAEPQAETAKPAEEAEQAEQTEKTERMKTTRDVATQTVLTTRGAHTTILTQQATNKEHDDNEHEE